MGTAFNKVIDILVKEVIMPPFLMIFGNLDMAEIKLVLKEAQMDATGAIISNEIAINLGLLIEALISFLILGVSMFAAIKIMNKLKLKAEDESDKTVATPKDIELMTKMTHLLEEQNELIKSKTAG
jgi:large conductance mechanosensitive channel